MTWIRLRRTATRLETCQPDFPREENSPRPATISCRGEITRRPAGVATTYRGGSGATYGSGTSPRARNAPISCGDVEIRSPHPGRVALRVRRRDRRLDLPPVRAGHTLGARHDDSGQSHCRHSALSANHRHAPGEAEWRSGDVGSKLSRGACFRPFSVQAETVSKSCGMASIASLGPSRSKRWMQHPHP